MKGQNHARALEGRWPGSAAPARDALTELLEELIERRLSAARTETDAAPERSPWLTVAEASAYCQLCPRVIYTAARSGKLRHARVGGRREIRLRREWLDAWLEGTGPREVTR